VRSRARQPGEFMLGPAQLPVHLASGLLDHRTDAFDLGEHDLAEARALSATGQNSHRQRA
jgi:hypothetical protein